MKKDLFINYLITHGFIDMYIPYEDKKGITALYRNRKPLILEDLADFIGIWMRLLFLPIMRDSIEELRTNTIRNHYRKVVLPKVDKRLEPFYECNKMQSGHLAQIFNLIKIFMMYDGVVSPSILERSEKLCRKLKGEKDFYPNGDPVAEMHEYKCSMNNEQKFEVVCEITEFLEDLILDVMSNQANIRERILHIAVA